MSEENAALPITAQDAADAWFRGASLRAFRVTAERATQDQIYAAAFEMTATCRITRATLTV